MISLIITSQKRYRALLRFVESLNAQKDIAFSDVQLIFIDQGDNGKAFEELNSEIDYTYLKKSKCSLSHARNVGLQYVKGEYIAFPDDDCWYEPDTLSRVLKYLKERKYQGITGRGTDGNGKLTSIFPKNAAELTTINRCAAISYTLFFKFDKTLSFDEDMGVGSPYNIGAGEETDYLLTLMEQRQYRVFYDPAINIHHPTNDIYDKQVILKKTYSYARGAGYLMQKHRFSFGYKFKQFMRPFCGIFVHLLMADVYSSKKSYLILKGRIEGYNWKKYDTTGR